MTNISDIEKNKLTPPIFKAILINDINLLKKLISNGVNT